MNIMSDQKDLLAAVKLKPKLWCSWLMVSESITAQHLKTVDLRLDNLKLCLLVTLMVDSFSH